MRRFPILLLLALGFTASPVHAQGALEPTAPPGPVMKTLDQVEPRTPISSAGPISASGSYYLTNDIVGRVTISANDVDLDLRGFTLDGTSVVTLEIPSVGNVRVHNGTVRGSSSASIWVSNASNVILENLRVLDSTNNAVQVFDHSGLIVIRSLLVDTAGQAGIRVANVGAESMEAVIEGNVVRNANTSTALTRQGIAVFHSGTGDLTASVSGNRVFNNRTTGLVVSVSGSGSGNGMITDNSAYGNGSIGLSVTGDFVTARNIAHANGINFDLAGAPNAALISALASAGPWDNVEQ